MRLGTGCHTIDTGLPNDLRPVAEPCGRLECSLQGTLHYSFIPHVDAGDMCREGSYWRGRCRDTSILVMSSSATRGPRILVPTAIRLYGTYILERSVPTVRFIGLAIAERLKAVRVRRGAGDDGLWHTHQSHRREHNTLYGHNISDVSWTKYTVQVSASNASRARSHPCDARGTRLLSADR